MANTATVTLPLRWCPPEVFEQQKFSQASDVWSFGVTMIEIYDRCRIPYGDWSNVYASLPMALP